MGVELEMCTYTYIGAGCFMARCVRIVFRAKMYDREKRIGYELRANAMSLFFAVAYDGRVSLFRAMNKKKGRKK